MTLRARLLAAFAYVLLLLGVALVVPFALSRVERIDDEVEGQAAGQAQLIAASASGRLRDRAELRRLVRRASRSLAGRVIVVDSRGRLLADSARPVARVHVVRQPPGGGQGARQEAAQGRRHSDSLDEDLLFTAVPVVRRPDRGRGAGHPERGGRGRPQAPRRARARRPRPGGARAGPGRGLAARRLALQAAPLARGGGAAGHGGRPRGGAEETGSARAAEVAVSFNAMTARLRRARVTGRVRLERLAPAANPAHRAEAAARGRCRKSSEPGVRRDVEAAEAEVDRLAALLANLLILAREEMPARDAHPCRSRRCWRTRASAGREPRPSRDASCAWPATPRDP